MNVKDFDIEYTGGGVYVAYGCLENGLGFSIGADLLCLYDEDERPILDDDTVDLCEWEEKHQIYKEDNFDKILKQIYEKCMDNDKDEMDLFRLNHLGGIK